MNRTEIRQLQTQLRTIASIEPGQMNVVPDGIYGPQTASAVRSFQRRMGLPQTGTVDPATLEQIRLSHDRAKVETGKAWPIQVTLEPLQVIRRGERNPVLYLVQSMLTVLKLRHPQLPAVGHTGVLDGQTVEALSVFQTFAELPPTGELDKRTWKSLAIQYALTADWLANLEDL